MPAPWVGICLFSRFVILRYNDCCNVYMKQSNTPGKRGATPAIKLPKLKDESEARSGTAPKYIARDKRVGFAFVGLGTLTLNELLPAVAESKMVKISALVSGSRKKAETVALQYGVPKTGIYN